MGNACECVRRQTSDEAEDALLASLVSEGTDGRPRGPPPPYQPQAPVYNVNFSLAALTEERRAQLLQRITIIQSLPRINYELRGDKEKKKESRECAICMMDYSAGEPIRLLPCMHYYHLHCIDDWLMRSLTCPMCMERVDSGLMTTLSTSGTGGNSRGGRSGRSRGFSLRRRRGGRGQGERVDESPLMSGDVSSCSSSRSSSTSSSTEYLSSPGGQFSWQGAPQNSQQQQQQRSPQPQGVHSETIFLPPFPTSPTLPRPRSSVTRLPPQNSYTDLGPLPQVVSPQSSQTVVLIHSPPPPPSPNVTVHKAPSQLPSQEER